MKLTNKILQIALLVFAWPSVAAVNAQLVEVNGHNIEVVSWSENKMVNQPTLLLLSGPIDNWHSDTAWWSSMAPELAKKYNVYAVERATFHIDNSADSIGYVRFAEDLKALIDKLAIDNLVILSFASSNISVQLLVAEQKYRERIKSVVLIDPDVLTDFSIARYASDAKPFKDNLKAYVDYIQQGKYVARVEQRNEANLKHLKSLSAAAKSDKQVDWQWVNNRMEMRLKPAIQARFFREIAGYHDDLLAAQKQAWPKSLPLLIFDTAFEQGYINDKTDEKTHKGLLDWQKDADRYYQKLTGMHSKSRHLKLTDKEHLLMFSQPNMLIEEIANWIK